MALATPAMGAERTAQAIRRRPGADLPGKVFMGALLIAVLFALSALVALLVTMLIDGADVWSRLGFFLTHGFSQTGAERSGVWQGIVGSLQITAIVAIVSFPLGIGAAIHLVEYAKDTRFTRFIEINVRNLAGVPSIVYGLLGLAIFVQALGDDGRGGLTGGRSVISGGLTLSFLVLPIVVITASEALRAVPFGIREGAYGVGATKWEMIRSHVIPAALPGILTGTVLSLARAIGEAAPLLVVGAVTAFFSTGNAGFVETLKGPFTALPMNIFSFARQPGDEWGANAAAASAVILVVVLLINGTAIYFRNRFEKDW